jgi:hypothetical protein
MVFLLFCDHRDILLIYRRGPMRYKFQVQYQLESLAVVNVRDLGNVKYAFKFLAFPDTRLFQCSTNQSKVTNIFYNLMFLPMFCCFYHMTRKK